MGYYHFVIHCYLPLYLSQAAIFARVGESSNESDTHKQAVNDRTARVMIVTCHSLFNRSRDTVTSRYQFWNFFFEDFFSKIFLYFLLQTPRNTNPKNVKRSFFPFLWGRGVQFIFFYIQGTFFPTLSVWLGHGAINLVYLFYYCNFSYSLSFSVDRRHFSEQGKRLQRVYLFSSLDHTG